MGFSNGYAPNDAVSRNGCGYIATASSTGTDPATDNGAHWTFVGQLS